jgi:hypothetical protein
MNDKGLPFFPKADRPQSTALVLKIQSFTGAQAKGLPPRHGRCVQEEEQFKYGVEC